MNHSQDEERVGGTHSILLIVALKPSTYWPLRIFSLQEQLSIFLCYWSDLDFPITDAHDDSNVEIKKYLKMNGNLYQMKSTLNSRDRCVLLIVIKLFMMVYYFSTTFCFLNKI